MKFLSIVSLVMFFSSCSKNNGPPTPPPNNNEFNASLTYASGQTTMLNMTGDKVDLGCSFGTYVSASDADDNVIFFMKVTHGGPVRCITEIGTYNKDFYCSFNSSSNTYGTDTVNTGSITFTSVSVDQQHLEGSFETTLYNHTNRDDSIKITGTFKGEEF